MQASDWGAIQVEKVLIPAGSYGLWMFLLLSLCDTIHHYAATFHYAFQH